MKVKEAIEKIKKSELSSIWDAEEIIFEDKNTKEVASDLNIDERRWYINSTSVYKLEDGYIGIHGPSSLKSEAMGYVDCMEEVTVQEYEEFTTISYRPKK